MALEGRWPWPVIAVLSNKEIFYMESTAISASAYHTKGVDIRDALSTRNLRSHIMEIVTSRRITHAQFMEENRAWNARVQAAARMEARRYLFIFGALILADALAIFWALAQ